MIYRDRIDRVTAHIRANLSGDLALDDLAEVAALSRFHFHRVFAAMQGETLADAVRRARLNRAAVLVVTTALPLARVGATCGYPDPDSFARAFRTAFGAPPGQLRRKGVLPPPLLPLKQGELPMHPVTIETWPDREAAALPHTGPYPRIGATFGRLDGLMRDHGLYRAVTGPAIAIYYDDPQAVPATELRSHAGMIVAPGTALPDGLDRLALPGGRFAVLTHRGPFDGLAAAWAWLYGPWLAQSGEALADRPPFELYPDDMATTPPAEVRTLICMPLA